ncbi:MAG TPA: hypothetical protein VNN79_10135 [Actinomycetota bacterium]|nr:hypothetical protein [Actinomycetota bacterium]
MTSDAPAGLLLIVGAVVFWVGAAIGVPRVFTEGDPNARLKMLQTRARSWRAAQPLYGLGALIAALGVGVLAAHWNEGRGRAVLWIGFASMSFAAMAWCWSLYLRGTRIRDFALGSLSAWPFRTYVVLTIAGLALLGVSILLADIPAWPGWVAIGADILFLVGYLRFGDIPPFVFYGVLLVIGVVFI